MRASALLTMVVTAAPERSLTVVSVLSVKPSPLRSRETSSLRPSALTFAAVLLRIAPAAVVSVETVFSLPSALAVSTVLRRRSVVPLPSRSQDVVVVRPSAEVVIVVPSSFVPDLL
ncbi:hypothetical protein [Sinorhizobium medicae]